MEGDTSLFGIRNMIFPVAMLVHFDVRGGVYMSLLDSSICFTYGFTRLHQRPLNVMRCHESSVRCNPSTSRTSQPTAKKKKKQRCERERDAARSRPSRCNVCAKNVFTALIRCYESETLWRGEPCGIGGWGRERSGRWSHPDDIHTPCVEYMPILMPQTTPM